MQWQQEAQGLAYSKTALLKPRGWYKLYSSFL